MWFQTRASPQNTGRECLGPRNKPPRTFEKGDGGYLRLCGLGRRSLGCRNQRFKWGSILQIVVVPFDATNRPAFAVDLGRKSPRILALVDHFFGTDHAALVEAPQVIVQELHAKLLASLNGRIDAEGLVLADEVGDGGVTTRNSYAATRPGLSDRRSRACERTAISETES